MVSFVKLARVFQQSAGLLKQSTKTVQTFRHLSLTSVFNAGKCKNNSAMKRKIKMQLLFYAILQDRESRLATAAYKAF